MTDELETIRERHAEWERIGFIKAGPAAAINAHADRATLLAHVDQLDAERKALRALCLEAAEFYGYGGTFPIRGVMAMRLTGAALGTLATALTKDATPSPGAITGIRKAADPCSDCIDGWCQMNCGRASNET